MLKTVEAPQVEYSDRIVDLPVATQCRVPTIQPVQETVDMPQVQFIDRVRRRIIEETDFPIPPVMEETIEVEKPKSQRFTLLADNKLAPKLDDGCAVQAPEWEELQRLRDEGSMTVHDTNKLPNASDNLELFKETFPSPIMMQVQSKRGVTCRARAVIRDSSGSSRDVGKVISMTEDVVSLFQQKQDDDDNEKTSCLIDTGRAQDEDTSLTTDIKSHASAITEPTEQQQHWHSNQQQSTRQAIQQQMGERGSEGGPRGREREGKKR